MSDLLVWVKLFLLVGGCVVTMVGLLWYQGGRLLRFFEINVDPEKGFKVAMVGFGMLLAGIGLVYLTG
ncbi:hypothetical protein D4S03_07130 [bacterium]|jgi:hypothetical protein|nr:MAG: hypothetical protein D4S03_07130 [bacterium]